MTLRPGKNIYLAVGTEELLRRRAVDAIVAESGVMMPELNITVFSGKFAVEDLRTAIVTIPMMSEKRVVIVRAPELFTPGKSEDICGDVPDFCILVFDVPKADKRSALYKSAAKNGVVIPCDPIKADRLPAEYQKLAAGLGLKLSPQAAAELSSRCSDLTAAENELVKLSVLGGEITPEKIKKYTADSLEYNVFALNRLMMSGRTTDALKLARTIVAVEKKPIGLVSLLSDKFRNMLHARAMLDAGRGVQEVYAQISNRYAAEEAIEGARKYSAKKLRAAIVAFAELDMTYKRSDADAFTALEMTLMKVY